MPGAPPSQIPACDLPAPGSSRVDEVLDASHYRVNLEDMNVSLTDELKTVIEEKVKSGLYNNASEVVRDALQRAFCQPQGLNLDEDTHPQSVLPMQRLMPSTTMSASTREATSRTPTTTSATSREAASREATS